MLSRSTTTADPPRSRLQIATSRRDGDIHFTCEGRTPINIDKSLIVVTGASSGIGAQTARVLARAGAHVILVARSAGAIESIALDLRDQGLAATAVAADLGQRDDASRMAQYVLDEIGIPDAIINNAGAGRFLRIEETDPAQAEEMMAAPYFAAFLTTRMFIEPMLARGTGTVLMVNSPVSIMPWPAAVGYASARFALKGFTEALRQDLRGTGLVVSSVTPTRVDSPYFDNNPGAAERIPKAEALLGSTTPDAVAHSILTTLERGRRDVHLPWRWAMMAPLARAFPRPVAYLTARTGAQRR
ncbi:MAG: short-chain dehydrogenase [Gordonia sp.]|nr:short-chain dehydrogenase [Gordonia sp. (in: high G+C Gram-positive bacteria)]